ncbi:uncharacterized protein Ecym_5438 [Eremothecium cymbalariae DBVPG|uniref:Dilute domain-containing protein n=1 Tax=Eremothecium cymbalariae (strain CBS 270.75 / DBVPG 7215 / KCTC 17166 / NRRL Y-17582) TaxID=931890 RepID=I6NDP8_ERECY|nr:hypothetical protein Ecym_5438 [Eremothecium cymbalariae DBVPG\
MEDPWKVVADSSDKVGLDDDLQTQQVKDSTKHVLDGTDEWSQLVELITRSYESVNKFKELIGEVKEQVNDKTVTGVPLLVYTVVYDHPVYIELLHCTGQLDVNLADDLASYSPLMWCFHLNRQQCCVELLNFQDELDFGYKNNNGSTAIDLLVPGSEIYSFAETHRLLNRNKETKDALFGPSEDLYKGPLRFDELDETLDNIKLQTAGLNISEKTNGVDDLYVPPLKTVELETSPEASMLFDFDHLISGQYIEFADYDIFEILNVLITLPQKNPHDTITPAALIFQCLRYAHKKRQSTSLVENIFYLSLTKILSSQQPSGGVVSNQEGDIVSQSYWLGYLTFLYYYLCRDETFFKKYTTLLQKLINAMQTLMIEICSSIYARIDRLVVPAILTYTTITDVKQTLYKKDWNIFKKKKHSIKGIQSSYDEILNMLYPPSAEEQMKVSPMKIVQIFGALTYVLDLHQVHPLFYVQCVSTSIQWFSTSLFNKIIGNKKYLSRGRAVQIRLNLSTIEDWIKNHDTRVPKSKMIDNFIWERFPYTLIKPISEINLKLKSLRNITMYSPVADDKEVIYDTTNTLFYYQSLYRISQLHMEPLLQLLQWLQVATSIEDEESLKSTMNLINALNPSQLLRVVEKYRYELEEPRFQSSLKKYLASMLKGQEYNIQLEERPQLLVTLPMMNELVDIYVTVENAERFLPILPEDIQEKIEAILEQNARNRLMDVHKKSDDKEDDVSSTSRPKYGKGSVGCIASEEDSQLFETLNTPSLAVQRPTWSGTSTTEDNPW